MGTSSRPASGRGVEVPPHRRFCRDLRARWRLGGSRGGVLQRDFANRGGPPDPGRAFPLGADSRGWLPARAARRRRRAVGEPSKSIIFHFILDSTSDAYYSTYHPRFGPQSTNASLHAHETLTWLSLSAFVRLSPIHGSPPHPWRACTRRARASPSSESLGTPEPRRCRPCSVLSRAWRWSAHACSSRQPRTTGSAVMPPIGASIE